LEALLELLITARNMEISEQAEAYVRKKFSPLQRRLRGLTEAKVEIRREPTRSAQHQVVVQVTLNVIGTLLRAEERAPAVNPAVDAVARALDRQVLRYKGQRFASLRTRKRGKSASIRSADVATEEPGAGEAGDETEELAVPSGRVVRLKRFSMKPLTVEEAAAQMELLGHNFFFFFNAATDRYSVLYQRRDGDYTIIEPEAQ